MGKNFIEQKSVRQWKYLLLAVDFFFFLRGVVEGGCLPRFSFEMSFKFSLKVPMAILRHVFVYLALEKKSSSFSFFFFFILQGRETRVHILFHGRGKFQLVFVSLRKKIGGYD